MSRLKIQKQELFCHLMARGGWPDDAYEQAGYTPGHHHGARLMRDPDIVSRIEELRAFYPKEGAWGLTGVTDKLVELVDLAIKLETSAAYSAARLMLADLVKLKSELQPPAPVRAAAAVAKPLSAMDRDLSDAEWDRLFGRAQ